jgi:feruloyl-CoA synthase
MVAERAPGSGWRTCGYGEAAAAADAIGQGLLDRGPGSGRPLLVLSGNSVDHLLRWSSCSMPSRSRPVSSWRKRAERTA